VIFRGMRDPGAPRSGLGIVFLCHFFDSRLAGRIQHLVESLTEDDRLYVLIDSADESALLRFGEFESRFGASQVLYERFSVDDLQARLGVPTFREGSVTPGSTHFPVLDLFSRTRHLFYWVVEWDVLVKGSWSELFDSYWPGSVDLVASEFRSYRDSVDWHWWKKPFSSGRGVLPLRKNRRYKAFFPVWGGSPRLLSALLRAHRRGWQGHFEALIPTLARRGKFVLGDLSKGNFVRRSLWQESAEPPVMTFRWRPSVASDEIDVAQPTTLFHPVKDLDLTPPFRV